MMRTIQIGSAVVFGGVLIVLGALGFVQQFVAPRELLLGVFRVDASQCLLYLATGMLFLVAVRWFPARIGLTLGSVGVLYGILGPYSFFTFGHVGDMVFNIPDRLFHIVLAVFALYIGFPIGAPSQERARALPRTAWDRALYLPSVREAEGSLL